MKFARWVFLLAGIYGLLAVLPQYFLEERVNLEFPPAITHPEYFYGFTGVALAWQIAFLIISTDPQRFRPIMLAGMVEKATFGIAAAALYLQQRVPTPVLVFGVIDLLLGALFVIAWWKTKGVISK